MKQGAAKAIDVPRLSATPAVRGRGRGRVSASSGRRPGKLTPVPVANVDLVGGLIQYIAKNFRLKCLKSG